MLEIPQETIAMAIIYFHRFYENELIEILDKIWLTICAALFLAGKSTENTRKARDVINVCYFARFGETMTVRQVNAGRMRSSVNLQHSTLFPTNVEFRR